VMALVIGGIIFVSHELKGITKNNHKSVNGLARLDSEATNKNTN